MGITVPIFKYLRNTPIHDKLWKAYVSSWKEPLGVGGSFSEWLAATHRIEYSDETDWYQFNNEEHFLTFLLQL
jgi:hypothetical protein